ncbi:MAG: alternative ribosome rescue aminoacyl-tRNA hydrolase ArfB [Nitriliruptorales bacterium]|nr:alternative ribosome rescue aminoacyl-tRNA hydrolase ArfB [Nitriliruptorales bacterium]
MADIRLSRRVSIPEHELEFRTSRSGGPGGQGVNTTASKVELRFDIDASEALSDKQKQRLHSRLDNRITTDGVLIIQSSEHRSQHQNREAAVARFQAVVGEAIQPAKRRKKTRVPRSQKRKRLEDKRRRSEKKRLRKPPEVP